MSDWSWKPTAEVRLSLSFNRGESRKPWGKVWIRDGKKLFEKPPITTYPKDGTVIIDDGSVPF